MRDKNDRKRSIFKSRAFDNFVIPQTEIDYKYLAACLHTINAMTWWLFEKEIEKFDKDVMDLKYKANESKTELELASLQQLCAIQKFAMKEYIKTLQNIDSKNAIK